MKILILSFDAPLVSFGGPAVDQHGVVQAFPALSMLTGLVANALGWDHRDADKLDALQERLRFASRTDRRGEPLRDYQTVDLGADWMRPEKAGWTTRGMVAHRRGASGQTTHQRYRHYRADSLHTVALALVGDEAPSLEVIAEALREPARPLYIGRRTCLPAAPLLAGIVEAQSLLEALEQRPRLPRADPGRLPVWCWEEDRIASDMASARVVAVTDERDWQNRVHVGRRLMIEGYVNPPEPPDGR